MTNFNHTQLYLIIYKVINTLPCRHVHNTAPPSRHRLKLSFKYSKLSLITHLTCCTAYPSNHQAPLRDGAKIDI